MKLMMRWQAQRGRMLRSARFRIGSNDACHDDCAITWPDMQPANSGPEIGKPYSDLDARGVVTKPWSSHSVPEGRSTRSLEFGMIDEL